MIHMKFCSTALTGQPVDVTVSQNGVKRALSVEAFGMPKAPPVASTPSARLAISARRGDQQIAPEGIAFFATVEGFDSQPPEPGKVYDPAMHDIHYEWSFGDSGTYSSYERMLPQWNDRNVAYGPFPAHVFSAPGTYTVICTAHERSSGKSASASYEVTVGDADTIFTNATTICVDPDGDFTGAPTTTTANRVTTVLAARDRAVALGNGRQSSRILLRSGKNHVTTSQCHLGSMHNVYINIWGGTAKAIITAPKGTGGSIFYYPETVGIQGGSISNIHMQGHWDAANPRLAEKKPMSGINAWGGFLTVHKCSADGVATGYEAGQKSGRTFILSDSSVENWQNIGLYGSTEVTPANDPALSFDSYFAIVGVKAVQNLNATQNGGGAKTTPYLMDNDLGVMRIQAMGILYVDGLEGFTRGGWSDDGQRKPADGAIIRDHRNDRRSKGFFSRIFGEGGFDTITTGSSTGGSTQPCNTVFDKIFIGGVAMSRAGINLHNGGTTLRNAIVQRPNKGRGWGASYNMSIDIGEALPRQTTENRTEPVKVYNVTIVNELDASQDSASWQPARQWPGFFDKGYVSLQNNIIHRPNYAGGFTGDGPLDSTKLGIAPRYLGYRWYEALNADGTVKFAAQMPMNTAYATPANPWSLWRPTTGSPAIGSATGDLVAYDDLLGNVRPAQASRGAVEPA